MKTVTTDVLRLCCVVQVLDSFCCGEFMSRPAGNDLFKMNLTTNNTLTRNNTQAGANNTHLTRNNKDVGNVIPSTKNNTPMASSERRAKSHYDSWTIDSEDGYIKPHEDSMKFPAGNDLVGLKRDYENIGQSDYYQEATVQVGGAIKMITNTDVMKKYILKTCPAHDDVVSFVDTNLEPKHCSGTHYQYEIRIKNSKECSRESFVNVNMSTLLSVEVDGVVSNCSHEIILFSPWPSSNIILKFKDFDIPGQKSTREPTCTDALEIFEVYKPSDNRSILSHLESGPYCNKLRSPDRIRFIQHNKSKLLLRISDQTQCADKISFKVIAIPCGQFLFNSYDCKEYVGMDFGEITSPGLTARKRYPNNLVCKWKMSVPQGNFIHLKFSKYDLGKGDIFSITAINRDPSLQFPEVLNFSDDSTRLLPFVMLPSNKCALEFRSDEFMTDYGFNVTFQAVSKTQFLPLLDEGLFNCSGIMDIPDSIRCNFLYDCVDGRDEVNCSYKHPDCPNGYFFEGTCLHILKNSRERFSWNSAQRYCRNHFPFSSLISFKTEIKREFYDKLQYAHRIEKVFLGLQRMHGRNIYTRMWKWSDQTSAFYLPNEFRSDDYDGCSLFMGDYFRAISCIDIFDNVTIVCEKNLHVKRNMTFPKVPKPQIHPWTEKLDVFMCGSGEIISIDQRCNGNANCFDQSDEEGCGDYIECMHKRYTCDNLEMVAYTFVCDGIYYDCSDNSDETICSGRQRSYHYNYQVPRSYLVESQQISFDDKKVSEPCPENTTSCPGLYCMPDSWITDGEIDCPIRDWRGKKIVEETLENKIVQSIPPPGIVFLDGYGKFVIRPLNKTGQCPSTHAQCVNGFCIPLALFGNWYRDCPYGEDELQERRMEICNGAYKCRNSKQCIRFHELCDGQIDCEYNDDETLCKTGNKTCPIGCECVQKEFVCTDPFMFDHQPLIKAHSFSISKTNLSSFSSYKLDSEILIFLEVTQNNIITFEDEDFRFPNLKRLNLSNNLITHLPKLAFKYCFVLDVLSLAWNQLQDLSFLESTPKLKVLDLSHNPMQIIKDETFLNVNKLTTLTLRNMGIQEISAKALWGLSKLKTLDLKGNDIITFSTHVFYKQSYLSLLVTDNFRLCCKHIAPSRILTKGKCITSYDDISSCDDMLRTKFLRTSLWVMALLTILGNVGVICHRIFWDKSNKLAYRVMITCLSLSDLMMGVYLVIIGIADIKYRDRFMSVEEEWKDSIMCRVAVHLCVLSSEVSALLILVVTLDRATAIALPSRRGLQMSNRSVGIVCMFVWLAGMTIASIPILPPFNSWELYSQLAVGVPLPLTRNRFLGYEFAFAIFIVLNVTTFIFVVLGLVIWLVIKKRSKLLKTEARMKQDLAIAQKLFLVVLTDCVCWFPISVMGFLTFRGVAVPGTMNIVATVFLLPANSALNPFLYTLNSLFLKNRKKSPSNSS